MSLLEVTGLRTEISTREGRVVPVDGVTFSLEQGEILGLVGESGSGKTMTGMSIMRLLPHGASITSGSIRFAVGSSPSGVAARSSSSRLNRRVSTSAIEATSFCPSTPLMTNRRYSDLRGSPSSNTTIDATTSVPCKLDTS